MKPIKHARFSKTAMLNYLARRVENIQKIFNFNLDNGYSQLRPRTKLHRTAEGVHYVLTEGEMDELLAAAEAYGHVRKLLATKNDIEGDYIRE